MYKPRFSPPRSALFYITTLLFILTVYFNYESDMLSNSSYSQNLRNDITECRELITDQEDVTDHIFSKAQEDDTPFEADDVTVFSGMYRGIQPDDDTQNSEWNNFYVSLDPRDRDQSYLLMVDLLAWSVSFISPYEYEYPATGEDGYCLTMKFEDRSGRRHSAKFQSKCKELYTLILAWLTSSRGAAELLEGSNVKPFANKPIPDDWLFYRLNFYPSNPAYFALTFRGALDFENDHKTMVTNVVHEPMPELEHDWIHGDLVNDKLELVPFTFKSWKKRNSLVIEKITEFLQNHVHVFKLKQEVKIEGHQEVKSGMTHQVYMRLKRSDSKITILDNQGYKINSFEKSKATVEFDRAGKKDCFKLTIEGEVFIGTEFCDLLVTHFF